MTIYSSPITGAQQEAETELQQALAAFYRAFNDRDLMAMEANWLPTPEAAMDNPLGGIKRGWSEIRSVYQRLFEGPTVVYVEFFDYSLHEVGDVFWAVGRERGWVKRAEQQLTLAIRTTRLFRRVGGQWRQVHHHGSIESPQLLADYQILVAQPTQS